MKTLCLLLILGFPLFGFSQNTKNKNAEKYKEPLLFLTLSSGLDNQFTLFGANVDYPIHKNNTVALGLGLLSSWNSLKIGANFKHFFKAHYQGLAIGAGLNLNPLTRSKTGELADQNGFLQQYSVKQKPVLSASLPISYYFKVNSKLRFFLESGISFKLTQNYYDLTWLNTAQPFEDPGLMFNILSPGGLMAAIGISYKIDK